VISIVIASAASAAWIPLTGDPVSLSSLPNGSLIVGDKEFSEFDIFGISTAGGVIPPNADTLFVQGGWDDATGNYGLRFLLAWQAYSGEIINATLGFKVAIRPGYDAYFIKDVWLYLTGVSATDTGGVSVGETVWDAPFPEGNIIASLSCSKQEDDDGANLWDSAEFAPLKEIWIRSKDISLTGGSGPGGNAHLSEMYQFYSQIPEPATLVLLGMGGVWIFNRRKRTV